MDIFFGGEGGVSKVKKKMAEELYFSVLCIRERPSSTKTHDDKSGQKKAKSRQLSLSYSTHFNNKAPFYLLSLIVDTQRSFCISGIYHENSYKKKEKKGKPLTSVALSCKYCS